VYVIRVVRDPVNFRYEQERMGFIKAEGLGRGVLTPGVGEDRDKLKQE
jgi:hypothetical protein